MRTRSEAKSLSIFTEHAKTICQITSWENLLESTTDAMGFINDRIHEADNKCHFLAQLVMRKIVAPMIKYQGNTKKMVSVISEGLDDICDSEGHDIDSLYSKILKAYSEVSEMPAYEYFDMSNSFILVLIEIYRAIVHAMDEECKNSIQRFLGESEKKEPVISTEAKDQMVSLFAIYSGPFEDSMVRTYGIDAWFKAYIEAGYQQLDPVHKNEAFNLYNELQQFMVKANAICERERIGHWSETIAALS